jgi:xylose isomerase
VLITINLKVQETTAHGLKFDIASTFDGLKRFILDAVEVEREE